jgi:hypothetical protein
MDYMAEIEHEYLLETGNDFSFLPNHGIFKTEITSLLLFYDTCKYDIEESISHFLGSDYLNKNEIHNSIHPYLKEFYTFYANKIFGNKKRIDFINKSAHIYLDNYRGNPKIVNLKLDALYKYPVSGTKFVDLLSGFNFIHFLNDLDENTTYYLVDKSLFTCECLNISIQKKKISNVFVINKDLKDVAVEDIGDKISVIRANNIWPYINNFQDYISIYKPFLMENGVFLFQEYSFNKAFSLINNPYTWLDSYFGDNWKKEFTIQDTENIRSFDTFIYRKPSSI